MEGGALQDRRHRRRAAARVVLIIDYDTDGADETCDVSQKDSNGVTTHVATAWPSDRAVTAATGIDLTGVWQRFLSS